MNDDGAGAHDAQQGPPPRSESLHASVERLIASGKELAEAEIGWVKIKGRSMAALLQRGLLFAVLATTSMMIGFSLLLVAGILVLAPLVGLLYATLIVVGIAFLVAIVFGLIARNAFRELIGAHES